MRIAVVGSGISGLGAAWLLARAHEVHLFEREARLGGHAYTVEVAEGERSLALDLGFLVYNEVTYPLLVRFFDALGVRSQLSDMSFGLRCDRCGLEYSGSSLAGLLAQPLNAVRPSFLRMLVDIVRFNARGRRIVAEGRDPGQTLGEFALAEGYSEAFLRHYLAPMAAAIWSSGTGDIHRFPIFSLLRFFSNHGLLGVASHLPWRNVVGGSQTYVRAATGVLGERVHAGVGATRVERGEDAVLLRLSDGSGFSCEAVVVATHADEALALLAEPTPEERELLGVWRYSSNRAVLHTDARLLPTRHAARASWSYTLPDCAEPTERVSVTYYLNRLQRLQSSTDYLVTLNPHRPPAPEKVLHEVTFTHPLYSRESLDTQGRLDGLQGVRRTYFCGAYFGWGFHEDGLTSAVNVAERLGVTFR
ncbi:MAG TPA: FAD-dependent oxidoreductase [Thermoanaerobaculaceae bacterium]|nr:FAD-dependent oxidoreductase [Thermoanaerobaculaceae bacterium]HRS14843.1 FAD-dependent oxidoreductase [Thermoanaerobaculaceae bacterium]